VCLWLRQRAGKISSTSGDIPLCKSRPDADDGPALGQMPSERSTMKEQERFYQSFPVTCDIVTLLLDLETCPHMSLGKDQTVLKDESYMAVLASMAYSIDGMGEFLATKVKPELKYCLMQEEKLAYYLCLTILNKMEAEEARKATVFLEERFKKEGEKSLVKELNDAEFYKAVIETMGGILDSLRKEISSYMWAKESTEGRNN